jgi:hypothetical protein
LILGLQQHVTDFSARFTQKIKVCNAKTKREKREGSPVNKKRQRRKTAFSRNRIVSSDSDAEPDSDVEPDREVVPDQREDADEQKSSASDSRRFATKRKWSSEDIEILKSEFKQFMRTDALPGWNEIDALRLPGWNEIDALRQKYACFAIRSRETIKAGFVYLKQTNR